MCMQVIYYLLYVYMCRHVMITPCTSQHNVYMYVIIHIPCTYARHILCILPLHYVIMIIYTSSKHVNYMAYMGVTVSAWVKLSHIFGLI